MRVLLYNDGHLMVTEIEEACYCSELSEYETIEASGEGLLLCGEDSIFGFPGISQYECEFIVKELYNTGKYDLTRHGNAM